MNEKIMPTRIEWTEEMVAAHLARFHGKTKAENNAPVPSPDSQPVKRPKSKGADKSKEVHPRYRIRVHSKRRRRTDSDGISVKAAIDGLVRGGLLGDDSPDWISQTPTQSQEKSKVEETIIEIYEIDD